MTRYDDETNDERDVATARDDAAENGRIPRVPARGVRERCPTGDI